MIELPAALINASALIGLFSITYLVMLITKNLLYYSRFKSFPRSLEEEKFVLIKDENKRLSNKIEQLEKENEQMTLMVLQKLQP